MQMLIRKAETSDLSLLVYLIKMLLSLHLNFDPDYYQLEDGIEITLRNWLINYLDSQNQFIFVAETESITSYKNQSNLAGFICGYLKNLYPWFKTKSVGHISYLIVDPQFQRRGIGRFLENKAIEWFKAKSVNYVEVYVDEKNSFGYQAWNKYGYLPFKKFLKKKI